MRLTILTTLWTLSEKGRRGNMRGWRAPSGSPAFSSAGLLLPLSPSMWWLPSSLAILSPHSRMNCDYTRKYATPPQPLLFQPHTLSSPFHMLHPFSESHFHLFRPYHGLWSLQEGLYRVDRDGSGKEPHPHFGGALQVAPHQAKHSWKQSFDWKYYTLFSCSKNLRALAKMPADFPYRFNLSSWSPPCNSE